MSFFEYKVTELERSFDCPVHTMKRARVLEKAFGSTMTIARTRLFSVVVVAATTMYLAGTSLLSTRLSLSSNEKLGVQSMPAQRCDYGLDEKFYPDYYDDECWRNYSVDDWRNKEGGASRALFDHGVVYLKNILEYEEAKVLREYLGKELSPRTLDAEKYFVPGFRNSTGRFDLALDPRVQGPAMDALNNVVARLKNTLEAALDSEATLQEFTVYSTCRALGQQAHVDGCSICCGAAEVYKTRLQEVSRISSDTKLAVMKPSHYEKKHCSHYYSIFIALQPTSLEKNGVTYVHPGSHLYMPWNYSSADNYGDVREDIIGRASKELPKCEASLNTGDGFIYNALTVHGANANPTDAARMMLVVSFSSQKDKPGRVSTSPTQSIHPDFVQRRLVPAEERLTDSECSVRHCMCKNMPFQNKEMCGYEEAKVSINHFPMSSRAFADVIGNE